MSKQQRKHNPALKAKVALEAVKGEVGPASWTELTQSKLGSSHSRT